MDAQAQPLLFAYLINTLFTCIFGLLYPCRLDMSISRLRGIWLVKCIHWTKSLGPLDLGPVQVIFSLTKWGVFLGPIPVGPGINLPVRPF